jgi:signal transduction histidine kinase
VVPEVTFCLRALERCLRWAQAAGMKEPLKTLLSPLNFAAYVAWAAIGWELVFTRWTPPPVLAAPAPVALLVAMQVAFLLLFMVVSSVPVADAGKRAMVLLQYGLAFALMMLARNSTLPILLILCAIQVVHLWRPRGALLVIAASNVAIYFVYRDIWEHRAPVIGTVMNLSFQAFAALTAWFAFRAEQARDELAAANADLLATRSLLAETARDSERLRLSRELHDVAGHKLTALKLNLAALVRDPRFSADEQVRLCARLADELLADIRGVVMQMRRDEGLDLAAALEALATPFERPRMHLQIEPQARVASVAQAEAVLRAVQEGLTNAVRHSQANNLWVVLRREAGTLRLDIRDDGRGSSGAELRAGNGLRGMRERLEGVGGGLDVSRTDTGGVHLQAWLPVAA